MNKPPTRKLREKHCSRELMNKYSTRKLRENCEKHCSRELMNKLQETCEKTL